MKVSDNRRALAVPQAGRLQTDLENLREQKKQEQTDLRQRTEHKNTRQAESLKKIDRNAKQ